MRLFGFSVRERGLGGGEGTERERAREDTGHIPLVGKLLPILSMTFHRKLVFITARKLFNLE